MNTLQIISMSKMSVYSICDNVIMLDPVYLTRYIGLEFVNRCLEASIMIKLSILKEIIINQ